MALYFASARWGDGTGIYNYKAEADRLLGDMKNHGVITGPAGRVTDNGRRPLQRRTQDGAFHAQHESA